MEKSREIRTILSSRVTFRNGAYMAAPDLRHISFVGLYDGSKNAMFFGVAERSRNYRAGSMDAAVMSMGKIFAQLGRPVYFESDPEQPARLIRVYGNPVILTMDYVDDNILISAYTARKLFASLTLNQAFRNLERHLPEEARLDFITEKLPKEPRETMRQRRVRKKTEKWERKAQRYEAKARAVGKDDNEE